MDLDQLVLKIERCYRYRDYETAIYLAAVLSNTDKSYEMLFGLLLHSNKEYARCASTLSKNKSNTALYYTACSLYELKQYDLAYKTMETLIKKDEEDEKTGCFFLDSFLIERDMEYFHMLMGRIKVQMGSATSAIEYFKKSAEYGCLLPVVENLYENQASVVLTQFKDDPIATYYTNITSLSTLQNNKSIQKEFEKRTPGPGTYFLAKLALFKMQIGEFDDGLTIYKLIRKKDQAFCKGMDVFSTYFWKQKKENLLGLLSKELIETNPCDEKTWIAVANYYSAKGDIDNSITCIEKSILIKESALANTLLGFEYVSKGQFAKATIHFRVSLNMQEKNSRALFGLGIAYENMSKFDKAETFLLRGLEFNSHDVAMQTYAIRFYTQEGHFDEAFKLFKKFMGYQNESIDVVAKAIKANISNFTENEELMVLEFVKILATWGRLSEARWLFERIRVRTSVYFKTKLSLETEAFL
ncbi:APC3 [Enterospora canceri]|uniref:APC3 n=1 Tax=Enterospora canceri TaxID=1081671 RepID=A0A1Y1S646_9MICR|nr:APC3 [Enterospora canceri]